MDRFAKPAFANDVACPVITMLDGPCAMSSWVQGYEIALDREAHAMYAPWEVGREDAQALPDEIPYANGSAVSQWASDWGERGNLELGGVSSGYGVVLADVCGVWVQRDVDGTGGECVECEFAAAAAGVSGGLVGGRVSWGVLDVLGVFAVWVL
ncbi:hypothetical protein GCG54_00014300 [Colletotrichum gloeosporioides]|uniref:Uncharacterized protein n=1 Tax=Colletotrichum gloeosporioides TaxID=474922 RepID=A0A8H4FHL7_COLGL|nr:uncharacterized protein GCG54_00014300 [Colletotrichum gloeosporioides]KAF3802593.1 hypothetical protein GCG54_00014300 [Colletotrichum gloeosporioides]